MKIKCISCHILKDEACFYRYKKSGTIIKICKRCQNVIRKEYREGNPAWKYPYKTMKDPNYIRDRDKLFMKHKKIEMEEIKQ